MRRASSVLAGLALLGSASLSAPGAALAQEAPCDAYAGTCPPLSGQPIGGGGGGPAEQPPGQGGGGVGEQPGQGGGGVGEQPGQGGGGVGEQPGQDGQPIQGGGGGAAEQPPAQTVGGAEVTQGVGVRAESATPPTSTSPSTLPFTGGEVVLLVLLGAGALAGGGALVLAGRRRSAGSPA